MSGLIQFDTHPDTLFVFIDEQYVGATPLDNIPSEPGSHEFRLSTSDLEDYTGGFVVYDNKKTHIIIDTINKKRYEEYLDIPPEEEVPPPQPPTEIGVLTQVVAQGLDGIRTGLSDIRTDTDTLVNDIAIKEGYGDVGKVKFTSSLVAITTASPNVDGNQSVIVYDPNQIACNDPTVANPVLTGFTGYDVLTIHHRIGRLAPGLSVFAAGTVPIYVRSTSDGKNFGAEIKIEVGRRFRFEDVYEFRLRAEAAGNVNQVVSAIGAVTVITYPFGGVYQVTEHETETELVNVNKTAILATVTQVPVPGGLPIGVPNNGVNTTIGIRAHIANTGYIFVGGNAAAVAAATFPPTVNGSYHTLEAGAAQRWNLAQGAQIFINASAPGQYVEFGQEADA